MLLSPFRARSSSRAAASKIATAVRPAIEQLENRQLMAATAEVTQSGSNYIVRVDGAQTYSGTNYSAALQNAAGTGERIMNVRVAGTITTTVRLRYNTTFNYFSSTRITASNTGPALYAYKSGGVVINGVRMGGQPGYGIRLSSCASPSITNVDMDFGGRNVAVGVRVDNEGSTRVSGLYIRNVRVANTQAGADNQGVETYGIDNYDIDGVTGVNLGGCGLLINDGRNGRIGTVTGDRCGNGTGYAAMRFANNCSGATVQRVNATNCGRGLFILNSTGITVNSVSISGSVQDSIWIQNGSNNKVLSGTVRGKNPVITNSPGSSINVSVTP